MHSFSHSLHCFDVERENCMFSGFFSLCRLHNERCYVVVDRCCCCLCCCCSCCCCRFQCPPADNICWRRENQNSKYRRKRRKTKCSTPWCPLSSLISLAAYNTNIFFLFFGTKYKNESHFLSSIQHYEILRCVFLRSIQFDSIRTKHAAVDDGRKEAAEKKSYITHTAHRTRLISDEFQLRRRRTTTTTTMSAQWMKFVCIFRFSISSTAR